jgi:glucose-6-phosphate 1-dehydrogenase
MTEVRDARDAAPAEQAGENPLLAGLRRRRTPEPCALTIFGASGDLTQRKLFPALYALAVRNLLPERFAVVGVARTEMSTDDFLERMRKAVERHGRDEFDPEVWDELAQGVRYVAMNFGDEGGWQAIADTLTDLDEERGTLGNRVYYLAVPPSAFDEIVEHVGKRRTAGGWTRVIAEKPFGHDLASARQLNATIGEYFSEDEIFRIDHYLGKETVQNMLVLRFANGIFEPVWNRQFIDHVQITVAESVGVEGRAGFYEEAGAVRDIVQNHLLQLVALTAMEPPIEFDAESVRAEKVKVLRSLHTPGPKHIVRGQYGPGHVEGKAVPGYREEPGVAPDSTTETYVAGKLFVDNWRWADTPFYFRSGKRLPKRETTIAIQFKRAPKPPFEAESEDGLRPNVLLLHIQPDEGVSLAIGAKVPGQGMAIRTVHMDFLYGGAFRVGLPEAYERLILDCMLGDTTLFMRADEVEEQWALVDAIVAPWRRDRPNFPNYASGTWGPVAADELLHRDGRSWRRH